MVSSWSGGSTWLHKDGKQEELCLVPTDGSSADASGKLDVFVTLDFFSLPLLVFFSIPLLHENREGPKLR